MKRSLVLLAPLVVAAGIFAVLVGGGDDPSDAGAGDVAVAPGGGVAEPEAEAADLSAPGKVPGSGAGQREVAEAERVARTEAASGPVTLEGTDLELHLVRASDGSPVAGAEVRVVHATDDWNNFDGTNRDDRLGTGLVLESDEAGRVSIPLAREARTWVEAAHAADGLWGGKALPRNAEDGHRLELEGDVTLRARVRDPLGAPIVGIPVAIRSRQNGWVYDRREASTDETGAAVFHHAQRDLRNRDGDDLFSLAVDALLVDPVERRFDPERPPTEEIELVLHATGSVLVRAYEATGEASEADGRVSVGIVEEGQARAISPFSGERRERIDAPLREGVARLPWVDLGQELEVEVHRESADVGTTVYVRGPVRPGEETEIPVTLGTDHPVLVFRALDAGGKPLTETELEVRVDIKTRHSSTYNDHPVSTDGEGRFLLDIGADWDEGVHRTLIVRRQIEEEDEPDAVASADLSRAFPPGITDMGDLVLEQAPVLVAGRVLDGTGVPVEGAGITVGFRQVAEDIDSTPFWNQTDVLEESTDAEGRFEIRDRIAGNEFRVQAHKEGRTGSPVVFTPGERNLVVRLLTAGTIRGRVLLDEGVPTDLLEVLVEPLDAPEIDYLEYGQNRDRLNAEGEYAVEKLLPGTYRVVIRMENDGGDLETREQVLVIGGEDTVLADVDLRGRLHVFRFQLVTAEPDEDVQGEVEFREAGSTDEEETAWQWFSTKEVVVASLHPAIDISFEARGYRPTRLTGVTGDTEVLLRRGIQVRVVLRGGAEIPPPPNYFKAVLVAADGNGWDGIDWGAPCFDEEREIVVAANQGGRMKVVWVVEKRTANSAMATTAQVEPDQFVEIQDIEGEQMVTVTLEQEQLDSILEAL